MRRRRPRATICLLMAVTFDISQLADELNALSAHRHLRKVVVVLPLAPGKREIAWDLLSEGPPFDFAGAGVDRHEVFLTDDAAIFVFGTPDGPATLERILGEDDFWTVIASWERIAGGPPRLAQVAFDWP
jgi:hypothetical protein